MFNKFIEIVMVVVIFLVIAVLGYIGGSYVKYYLDIRKADRSVENFQNALEQPYKEDVYGGKTPEETWGMFLDALRKGDIDIAVKYYAVGVAVAGSVPVDEIYRKKQNGQLDEWIKELEGLKKSSREPLEGEANYYYDYYNEKYKQILSSPVVFYLNPYTKVWKIISL